MSLIYKCPVCKTQTLALKKLSGWECTKCGWRILDHPITFMQRYGYKYGYPFGQRYEEDMLEEVNDL